MKELDEKQIEMIAGGATTEQLIGGGAGGALGGAGVAGAYLVLASNPAGWVVLGLVVGGAAVGAGYAALTK